MTVQPFGQLHRASAFCRAMRVLQCLVLGLLIWCAGAGSALAAATVTGVLINGGSTANVMPGSAITVTVLVSLDGSRWRMTQIDTVPVSSMASCQNNTDVSATGNYSFTFDAVAPATNGTFDLVIALHPNANCSSGPVGTRSFGDILVTDNSFPVVLSITRNLADPTNASPVSWTVTFDRSVTGVTPADFALAASGVSGTALTGSYTATNIYTLQTPNTGSGTLGVNLVDDDSIVGPNGRPLGGAGTNNGNFTGQVYTIDRTGPTMTSVAISSTNPVSPLFVRPGETVNVAFTTADPSGVQKPTATINGVTATVTGSGNSWVASRTVTAGDAEGLVTFKLDVTDTLGNVMLSRTTVTDASSVTLDKTAPTVSVACASPALCGAANPTAASQVSWTVTFSEPVTGLSAANFTFSGSGASGASIASVSGGPRDYTVVANITSAGVVGLNFSLGMASVFDRAGNSPGANMAGPLNSYTKGGCSVAAGGGCTFNAVEAGGLTGSPIFTKRVGAAVSLDILAMNGSALNTSSNDSVVATLVVANGSASCGTVTVSNAQTIAFSPADGGRRNVSFTATRAARDVRVRLVSGGVTACSLDNFAVRPDSFMVSSSSATADATGVSASANPVFKAGSGLFSIQATASAGYDGIPKLSPARALVPGGALGALSGTFTAASPGTGMASGAGFTYREAGYVRLGSWGVYDDGAFAAVDATKGECFSDAAIGSANAPVDPNTPNAGKLGCYFGSVQSPYFGRFIPDHFSLSAATIVKRSGGLLCAASTFTYMGEEFTAGFVLTAQNFQNATTANYTGDLARLNIPTQLGLGAVDDPASSVRRPLAICPATPAAPVAACLSLGTPSGTFTNGVSNAIAAPMTVLRATTPTAPMNALKVGVAPMDIDGVGMGAFDIDTFNVTAGTPNHAFVAGNVVRYGRLQVDNAYGSELLNLSVNVTAQYWTGLAYARNTLDSCTPLGPSGFTVAGQSGGITSATMNASHLVAGTAMANGMGRVVLTKPSSAPTIKGRALLQSANSYLPGAGRVTFGVYKAGPVIYVRETY